MHNTKVVPEFFSKSFNSKRDLYTLMRTDCNFINLYRLSKLLPSSK